MIGFNVAKDRFKTMIRFSKPLAGGVLALSLFVAGCQTQDVAAPVDSAPVEEDVADDSAGGDDLASGEDSGAVAGDPAEAGDPVTAQSDNAVSEGADPADMMAVSIYKMDDQCNTYEAETVQVERDEAMSQAVGKVMTVAETYDKFELAGYRFSYDADSDTATIDLRLSPDSERQFVSLSSCEQRSLFGSVEETLTQNSDWAVETVEFTDRGEELLM